MRLGIVKMRRKAKEIPTGGDNDISLAKVPNDLPGIMIGEFCKKVTFPGSNGSNLAGLLEMPASQPAAVALFAHCFTCGKDSAAASRISRALVANGYAVMRFDFTGLGGSDGDFANTNFSSNIEDLLKAAGYLRENYLAPHLLIGHSLGGTAVLRAAKDIPECRGVVTIGSPADAEHVIKQFSADLDHIDKTGAAKVNLAGREFTIKKQFVEDLSDSSMQALPDLRKNLLIFHSPVDTVVSINEAEKIYTRARHPKSFISLDNADHLLTNRKDAEYVATIIAAWASRSNELNETSHNPADRPGKGRIIVEEKDHVFTQIITSDGHTWLADEPASLGGANLGPDPYEHLLAALGSCTAMTIRMYATRKNWPVEHIKVELSHSRRHGEDCEQCDEEHSQIALIERQISLGGHLDNDQRARLLEIADRCPVHKTLHGKIVVESKLTPQ